MLSIYKPCAFTGFSKASWMCPTWSLISVWLHMYLRVSVFWNLSTMRLLNLIWRKLWAWLEGIWDLDHKTQSVEPAPCSPGSLGCCRGILVPPASHGIWRELGPALSGSKTPSFMVHWLGNDTAQAGGPERHLKDASFQEIIFPLMKEIDDKLLLFLTLRQKTLTWVFSPCRQTVPCLITQCCLCLPAVPSSCNVSTLQYLFILLETGSWIVQNYWYHQEMVREFTFIGKKCGYIRINATCLLS